MHKNRRPTFHHDNNIDYQIRAGGIILYRYNGKKKEFLMIKVDGKYEDFGGKTDKNDKTIEETIAREAEEESNSIFKKEDIMDMIKRSKPIYLGQSKYIIYFIRTDMDYDSLSFGNKENYNSMIRTVEWVPMSKLKSNMLHIRLKEKLFYQMIKKL